MTAESLLDAIGLLDDDLIAEADRIEPVPGPLLRLQRHSRALAACLLLALSFTLIWSVSRLAAPDLSNSSGGGGASYTGGGEAAPAGGEPASSAGVTQGSPSAEPSDGDTTGTAPAPNPGEGISSPASGEAIPPGTIFLDGRTYSPIRTADRLPEGAVLLGTLESASQTTTGPSTDIEAYVGLSLWSMDDTVLFLELQDGSFVLAEQTEP